MDVSYTHSFSCVVHPPLRVNMPSCIHFWLKMVKMFAFAALECVGVLLLSCFGVVSKHRQFNFDVY